VEPTGTVILVTRADPDLVAVIAPAAPVLEVRQDAVLVTVRTTSAPVIVVEQTLPDLVQVRESL
jgi:hypothetical protein